jgi:hypothetical protein
MRRSKQGTSWTCALALLALACSATPSPVPMIGPEEDLSVLAGEWIGEYTSRETGRAGSISFKLEAGKDTAFGDVLMVPREPRGATPDPQRSAESMRTAPHVLTIAFVRVSGSSISGTIDPYPSPDCSCTLTTVFRGQIEGDRIAGEFLIRHSGHEMAAQQGTWWAERKR